jgi:hypothetical protein
MTVACFEFDHRSASRNSWASFSLGAGYNHAANGEMTVAEDSFQLCCEESQIL